MEQSVYVPMLARESVISPLTRFWHTSSRQKREISWIFRIFGIVQKLFNSTMTFSPLRFTAKHNGFRTHRRLHFFISKKPFFRNVILDNRPTLLWFCCTFHCKTTVNSFKHKGIFLFARYLESCSSSLKSVQVHMPPSWGRVNYWWRRTAYSLMLKKIQTK